MTIIELAEAIGVSPATLKRWEKCLDLDVPLNEQFIPVYDEKLQEILRQVSNLRKTGNSFEKIANILKIAPYNSTTKTQIKQDSDDSINTLAEQNKTKTTESSDVKVIKKVMFPRVTKDGKEEKNPYALQPSSPLQIVIKDMELPVFGPGKAIKETPDIVQTRTVEEIEAPVKDEAGEKIITEQDSQDIINMEISFDTVEESTKAETIESPKTTPKEEKDIATPDNLSSAQPPFDSNLSIVDERVELKEIKPSEPQVIDYKDGREIMSAYIQLTEAYKTLAAKYSEATFKIGQLEERSRNLTLLIEQKQLFLPLQEQVQGLNQKLTETREDLTQKITLTQKQEVTPQKEEQDDKSTELEELEKQVKLLTVFLLNQKQPKQGFWAKIKSFFFRK